MITNSDNFFGLQSYNLNLVESLQKQEIKPEAVEQYNIEEKDGQLSNEDFMKTPKSKLSSKLSSKTNPQELSPSKTPKLKPKKSKLFSSQKQKNPNQLSGHWSLTQNKRYHWFLQTYYSHFLNRSMRRMDRVFTSMSKFVGTREAQQCRSHHQKMQKKYKSFARILLSLRKIHYDSHDDKVIKTDMDENKIVTNEALLTEEFLLEHTTQKQLVTSQQKEKQESRVESPIFQSQQQNNQDHNNQQGMYTLKDCDIQDILPLELESSKNDCFRFLSFDHQRNNIMDDEYENKLTFDPFY